MRRLLLAALLPACGASAPAPTPAAKTEAAPPAPVAEAKAPAPTPAPAPAATRPKEPPLTQEELDLIAADPATLTPEQRRDRAFALRRKIMQNPDSPAARQLEEIRQGVESGAIKPQLPKSDGLVLRAPDVNETPAPASTPTPAPAPGKSP